MPKRHSPEASTLPMNIAGFACGSEGKVGVTRESSFKVPLPKSCLRPFREAGTSGAEGKFPSPRRRPSLPGEKRTFLRTLPVLIGITAFLFFPFLFIRKKGGESCGVFFVTALTAPLQRSP